MALTWSRYSLERFPKSAPNKDGADLKNASSSLASGSSDLLIAARTFSRLRREILALAFPISWMAVMVASLRAVSDISRPCSASSVRGARESRTRD